METEDRQTGDVVQRSVGEVPRVQPDRSGPGRIEVLSVGRELLRGKITDGNARKIAAHFSEHGAEVRRITVVDDDLRAISQAMREALERNPHLLVITGGLGPAPDDLTLAALSDTLKLPLSLHQEAKSLVEETYRNMAQAKLVPTGGLNLVREKMCRLPVGASAVPNQLGISPGVVCRLPAGAVVLCLPGKPIEMQTTLKAAMPLLKELLPRAHVVHREIESPTSDESSLNPLLEQLHTEFPSVWITSHPSGSRKKSAKIMISFETSAPEHSDAETTVNNAVRRLLALAGGAL